MAMRSSQDRSDDLVVIGFADIAVLHKKIFGILRKVRDHQDTEGRGAVVL